MMNKTETQERLIAVYNALNNIEVKGHVNMCNMAGCIQVLQEVLQAMSENNNDDEEPAK
jgi:hypothetical protein